MKKKNRHYKITLFNLQCLRESSGKFNVMATLSIVLLAFAILSRFNILPRLVNIMTLRQASHINDCFSFKSIVKPYTFCFV